MAPELVPTTNVLFASPPYLSTAYLTMFAMVWLSPPPSCFRAVRYQSATGSSPTPLADSEQRTGIRRNIKATTSRFRVRVDQNNAMLIRLRHQLRLRRIALRRTLAVMYRHDDGSRLGEGLGNVRVHAHLRRASIEVIDFLQLGTSHSCECCEDGEELHRDRVL